MLRSQVRFLLAPPVRRRWRVGSPATPRPLGRREVAGRGRFRHFPRGARPIRTWWVLSASIGTPPDLPRLPDDVGHSCALSSGRFSGRAAILDKPVVTYITRGHVHGGACPIGTFGHPKPGGVRHMRRPPSTDAIRPRD